MQALPPPRPRNTTGTDGPRRGRLWGWQARWPKGWPRRVVKRGLKWEWSPDGPPPLRRRRPHRNTPRSILHRVQDLLRDDVIEPASSYIFLNRLFEVPKKDSPTPRLVLDVSALNKYIPTYKFRMTSTKTVRQTLRRGWYMASIDLKDAYWHIPIAPSFRPYLAFSSGQHTFQFKVMPFGLNIAPRIFTKILQPIHAKLSSLGVHVLMYLDDWLLMAPSKAECDWMVQTTLRVGEEMGLLFNKAKSHLSPTTTLQWLGMTWNSEDATLTLSEDNQRRCTRSLFRALHSRTFTRRQWESLVGSLSHASTTVPLGRLRTRRLLVEGQVFLKLQDRDTPVPFPRSTTPYLKWWLNEGRLRHKAPWVDPPPFLDLTTDASNQGWGYQSSLGHQGQGTWDRTMDRAHINTKELMTVWLALMQEPDIRDGVILALSDNTTTVQCITKQGTTKSRALLKVSELLLEEAYRRNLTIKASYLAGVDNTWADALSRGATTSVNWSLTPKCFDTICTWAGTPQVDLFASQDNHLLPAYLSLTEHTGSGPPDAFQTDWNTWNFIYLFPPPHTQVMLRVVSKLEAFRGQAVLVAPYWETQPWFPLLLRLQPRSMPLPLNAISQEQSRQLLTSLRLTAWHFSA